MATKTRAEIASGLTIRPVSAHTGAEISGVDVSEPLPDAVRRDIRQALNDWGVVFFRDQELTPAQQLAFARQFGTAEQAVPPSNMPGVSPDTPEVKEVTRLPGETRNIGGFWHSDMSFRLHPQLASVLYARVLPPYGGDTMFTHMGAAYDALSPGLQATLERLSAVHVRSHAYGVDAPIPGVSPEYFAEMRKKYAGVEATHPVVARHPETGRKVLYFGPVYTDRFDGWTREESLPLLRYLTDIATRPELVCRFRWEPGSLAMWDNRAVLHYALDDYQGHKRVMHRVTVTGPWLEPCTAVD